MLDVQPQHVSTSSLEITKVLVDCVRGRRSFVGLLQGPNEVRETVIILCSELS